MTQVLHHNTCPECHAKSPVPRKNSRVLCDTCRACTCRLCSQDFTALSQTRETVCRQCYRIQEYLFGITRGYGKVQVEGEISDQFDPDLVLVMVLKVTPNNRLDSPAKMRTLPAEKLEVIEYPVLKRFKNSEDINLDYYIPKDDAYDYNDVMSRVYRTL